MTELVQAIMSARYLYNSTVGVAHPDVPFDIAYRVQKYKKYDTLVLYRTETAYIADNILPRGTAQALHPMPFPDTSRLVEDHRLQIYNAAWNGLILGYPSRFVQSYCKDFHNDLPTAEKEQIYRTAKSELEALLRDKYGMNSIPTIKVGMVPPVHKLIWESIEKLLLSQPPKL
jgi:hypothetical protein